MNVGALEIEIFAGIARLQEDMRKATGIVNEASNKMSAALRGVGGAVQALGIGLSAAAFAGWIKGAINAADETNRLRMVTGLAAQDIAGLQLAMQMTGGNADQLQKLMAKLSTELFKGNDTLRALGITTTNAREALGQLADKVVAAEDGTLRMAIATGALGKSGEQFIPMLLLGAKGLAEFDEQARKLGLTLDDETVEAADEFNDTLEGLGFVAKGLATQVAAQLLPSLQSLAGGFLTALTEGNRLQTGVQVLSGALKILFTGAAVGIEIFNTLGKNIGALAAAAVLAAKGEFRAALEALKAGGQDMIAGWKDAAKLISDAWSGAASSTAEAAGSMAKRTREAQEEAERLRRKLLETSEASKAAAKEAERAREAAAKGALMRLEAMLDRALERHREYMKLLAETAKHSAKLSEAEEARTRELADSVRALQDENLRLREGDAALIKRQVALLRLQAEEAEWNAQMQNGSEALKEQARLLREKADLLEQNAQISAAQKAAKESAKSVQDEFTKISDQIGQSLADALMRGGRSAAEYIRDLFRTMVLRPVIQAIVMPVAGLFGATGANASTLMSGQGGVGGLLQYGANLLQNGWGFLNGSMLSSQIGGGYIRLADWLSTSSNNTLAGLGSWMQGGGAGLGSVLGMLGNAGAGFGLSRLISNGYQTSLGPLVDIAGTIASMFLGPIGGVIGGLINRAFGHKLKDWGIEGQLAGGEFSGSQFQFYKGGLFTSDKTKRSPLSQDVADVFNTGAQAMLRQVQEYANVLGLPADAVARTVMSIKISTKNLKPEEIQQKIVEALTNYGNTMAQQYKTLLDPFQKAGETLLQTMQRLTVVQSFSNTLNELGGVFAKVARLSVDARERFFEMAGGMEALGAAAMGFVQQYYSREEIAGLKAREIAQTLQGVGLTTDFTANDPRAQYRALVESIDVSTQSGQKQLLTLLGASNQFAQVSDYMQQTGLSLSQVAAQAPATAALQSLFGAQQTTQLLQQGQLDAMQETNRGINIMIDWLKKIHGSLNTNGKVPPPQVVYRPLAR